MPTEVDGSRRDVDVHQVVDDPALDVVQHPVHQVAPTHVHDLNVGQVPGTGKKQSSQAIITRLRFLCKNAEVTHVWFDRPEGHRVIGACKHALLKPGPRLKMRKRPPPPH